MPDVTDAISPRGDGFAPLPPATKDPEKIRSYLSDESSAMSGSAERVYFPENAGQVSAVLRAAAREEKKVTVSAAGTSITGARVPLSGGWVLSIERIRRIVRDEGADVVPAGFVPVRHRDMSFYLNPETRQAIAPAGITLNEFNEALARYNLVYPPDPTEMTAMLGGTVATNASGARSFHYKPTRRWVRGLEVVLPTGEPAWMRRGERRARKGVLSIETAAGTIPVPLPRAYPVFTSKNAAGLYLAEGMDPVDLFIGSEGLLGVITAVQVGLVEIPRDVLTCVAFFGSIEGGLAFVDELRESAGATREAPLSLEYFDRRALSFLRDSFSEIPEKAAGAVLFEFEYDRAARHNPYPARTTLDPWIALLEEHRAISSWNVTGRDVSRVREFRHALPEAVNTYVRARVGKLGTDMAVPARHFRTMVEAYEKADSCGVKTVFFGHIGDCHLHLNFLPENREELAVARTKYLELARLAVHLGGTISAEHGVGKKTIEDEEGHSIPYLEVMLGAEGLRAIHAFKKELDPHFTLNPGNMVPEGYC